MQRYTIYYYLPKLDNVVKRHDSNVVEDIVMIITLSDHGYWPLAKTQIIRHYNLPTDSATVLLMATIF